MYRVQIAKMQARKVGLACVLTSTLVRYLTQPPNLGCMPVNPCEDARCSLLRSKAAACSGTAAGTATAAAFSGTAGAPTAAASKGTAGTASAVASVLKRSWVGASCSTSSFSDLLRFCEGLGTAFGGPV